MLSTWLWFRFSLGLGLSRALVQAWVRACSRAWFVRALVHGSRFGLGASSCLCIGVRLGSGLGFGLECRFGLRLVLWLGAYYYHNHNEYHIDHHLHHHQHFTIRHHCDVSKAMSVS